MYPSDYADTSYWTNAVILGGLTIRGTSWMYETMPDAKNMISWLLSLSSNSAAGAMRLTSLGGIGDNTVFSVGMARPVLTLKSDVKITNLNIADGSINKPYILEI